jgi:hypothetical protein
VPKWYFLNVANSIFKAKMENGNKSDAKGGGRKEEKRRGN